MKRTKYPNPPKAAFREMGLGILVDGHIKVVAGFTFAWWSPSGKTIPHVVSARVLRLRGQTGTPDGDRG
jgi:hypothetical protein